MGWRVTVRTSGQVAREAAPSQDAAAALAAERADALAAQVDGRPVEALGRRYEATDLVSARVELRGPQRWRPDVRGGFDVRGDGGLVTWVQRRGSTREAVDAEPGEAPLATLRRALAG